MRITLKQLKHLSVETKSGTSLGHVHDLIFEVDGQIIAQYLVRPSIIGSEYTIGRDQIVHFTETKIIVEDSIVSEKTKKQESKKSITPNPALAREES